MFQHTKVGALCAFALSVRNKSKRLVQNASTVYEVGRDKLVTLVMSCCHVIIKRWKYTGRRMEDGHDDDFGVCWHFRDVWVLCSRWLLSNSIHFKKSVQTSVGFLSDFANHYTYSYHRSGCASDLVWGMEKFGHLYRSIIAVNELDPGPSHEEAKRSAKGLRCWHAQNCPRYHYCNLDQETG